MWPATSLLSYLYCINWLVLITEIACAYCAVRTESLSIILVNFSSLSRGMAQAVSRQPLLPEARIKPQATPCEICGAQSSTGAGFLIEYFGFPLPVFHHCSILIFIYMLLLPKGQTGGAWALSKGIALSGIREHWVEELFHSLYPWNFDGDPIIKMPDVVWPCSR